MTSDEAVLVSWIPLQALGEQTAAPPIPFVWQVLLAQSPLESTIVYIFVFIFVVITS